MASGPQCERKARYDATDAEHVSPRSIQRAKTVTSEVAPELVEAVKAGKVKVWISRFINWNLVRPRIKMDHAHIFRLMPIKNIRLKIIIHKFISLIASCVIFIKT